MILIFAFNSNKQEFLALAGLKKCFGVSKECVFLNKDLIQSQEDL